jgi:hypothetical protein
MLLNRGEFPGGWRLKNAIPQEPELRCLIPFLGKEVNPFKVFIRQSDLSKTIKVTLFGTNGKCRDLTLDYFETHPSREQLEKCNQKKLRSQNKEKGGKKR